jgi:predicted DNA-binding transcriptional regulator AlpA
VTPRLNYRDAALLLGIPVGTLRSMVCRRQVPHIRISPRVVVFDVAALEEWIALRRVGVANEEAGSLDGNTRAA